MTTINPSLASAALSIQNQQNGSNLKVEPKMDERSQESQRTTSTTSSVTLSGSVSNEVMDYLELSNQQTVRNSDATENPRNEANHTSSGLTYASDLQMQSNYLSNQPAKN
jgi:hypothetical protein